MQLFGEFERTHDGPADPGESFHSYIDRSVRPEAAQARDLCNLWFADYANDASKDELSRFLGDFRSKDDNQHYAAWFELLTHQILVRLGLYVTIHPELPGTNKSPDFEASSNGSRVLVEATVVAPDKDVFAPSNYERDAQEKFTQLEIANFTISIVRVKGTLTRHLKNKIIKRQFGRLVAGYDPDKVQLRIKEYGYGALPTEHICFGDWQVWVRLNPLPAGKRAPRKARVAPWPQTEMYDRSVPNAKRKIREKRKCYGRTDDRLILAVNVHNRGGFNPEIDGRDVLFGKDGIWNGSCSRPAAVLFITNTNSYAVPSTEACLFVNPVLSLKDLPGAMLRLPHIHGPDGLESKGGETVPSILGLH